MEDYFTMMMMLQMQPEADLEAIKQALSQVENTLSVKISIQNERSSMRCINYNSEEMMETKQILETIRMVEEENLDIRTITMGISLLDCIDASTEKTCQNIYNKITGKAKNLVKVGDEIASEFGIPIINKRISVTPIAIVASASGGQDCVAFARVLDKAAKAVGINFIGGYSALVEKGYQGADLSLDPIDSGSLGRNRICLFFCQYWFDTAGINMDAVKLMVKPSNKPPKLQIWAVRSW